LLDEENDGHISEECHIPLGYIRQLLRHIGDFSNETEIAPDAVMKRARSNRDVLPNFPGMPLTGHPGSLSLAQLRHLEETHQRLITEMGQTRVGEDYEYLLAIWEQLIYEHRGWHGRRYDLSRNRILLE